MVCIYCGSKTEIINSRHWSRDNTTWRRRKCGNCSAVFTTSEIAQYSKLWAVKNSLSNRIQPFSRDKLYLSVYDSCKHRKSAIEDASGLTDTIIIKLLAAVTDATIDGTDLKVITYETINKFDKAAGVHYLAYHGPF